MSIPKAQSAFTLIEIIITTTLLVFVTYVAGNFIIQSYQTIKFAEETNAAIENAKAGIKIMNQELREAATAENGSYAIDTAADFEIIFYSDTDIDNETEQIRYFLDGTDLKKGTIEFPYTGTEQEVTIAQYVQNGLTPIFNYYDINNNLLTSPIPITQIRLIKARLEINLTPENAPINYNIEKNVHLRNLKPAY